MQSTTPDPATLIADLREKWPDLKDIDRAIRVHELHHLAHVSLRALAKELNCSSTLLRRLNQAAQASKLDRSMARQRRLSTRELARRARVEKELQANQARESAERERKRAVEQVCQAIGEWLQGEGHSGGQGEQIIDEARYMLASTEATNQLPRVAPPQPGTPIEQIIKRTRPTWPAEDLRIPWMERSDPMHWYAEWLVRWVYFALPDSHSRYQALESALELQYRVK